MWASHEGHVECVRILLDMGAKVDMQDSVSNKCHIFSATSNKRVWEHAQMLYNRCTE